MELLREHRSAGWGLSNQRRSANPRKSSLDNAMNGSVYGNLSTKITAAVVWGRCRNLLPDSNLVVHRSC
jgi:hypothetical protein